MLLGNSLTTPFYISRQSAVTRLATTHYNRVIYDGGVIDSYSALTGAITSLFSLYGVTDLTNTLSAAIDPSIFGYKVGAGSGITLDKAANKLYSLMGADTDLVQGTGAAQPLLLRWDRRVGNYFFPGGTSMGNGASTPNAVANQISGDLHIWAKVSTTATGGVIMGKNVGGGNNSFYFTAQAGALTITLSFDGATTTTYTSTVSTIPANTDIFVRVFRNGTTGDITFYTSPDGTTWTQFGAIVAGATSAIHVATAVLEVGSRNGQQAQQFDGKIYSANLAPNATFTPTVAFNAEDYDVSVSQNTMVSSLTGETWTINRSANTTAYKAQLVYRTTTQTGAVDDQMATDTSLVLAQPNTVYSMFDETSWDTARVIVAGGSAIPYSQTTGTPNISASAGADLDFDGEALNRLKHYMIQFDDANSITGVDGVYQAAGAAGNGGFDDLLVMGSDGTSNFANAVFNSLVISQGADSLSERDGMNVVIRGWNGNPV